MIFDKKDIIWESVPLLLLLAQALIIASSLSSLPDTVAVHFNGSGKADAWGNKNILWIPFGLSVFMYALLTFVSFRPGVYKWRMTEKNLEQQYRLTAKMSRTVKTFVILAFIVLSVFLLKSSQGLWTDLTPVFFIVFFTLIITPCLYYTAKFTKIR